MKKILFLAIATVAMTFAACGGKQQAADAIDPAAVAQLTDATEVQSAANQAVEALQEQLANADKAQVESILAKAVEAANGLLNNGNVEGATQYVQGVLSFVQENQEALVNLGIDATTIIPSTLVDAASAATTLQQAESACESVPEQLEEQAEGIVEAGQQAAQQVVNNGAEQLQQAGQQASQAAQQAVSNGAQQVNDAVNQAAQQAIRRIPGSQQ